MKDILDQLKTLTVSRCADGYSDKPDYIALVTRPREFGNIQINYGVKKGKISVKLGFNGCSFTGNSGQSLHCAILNALKQARESGYKVVGSRPGDFVS